MEILQMRAEDIKEVAKLEAKLFSLPWSEKGFLDSLCSEYTIYLVVKKEGRIVGYCGLVRSFDEADITNVAVDPGEQNQGIGYAMLSKLMELGRQAGICRFTLEVRAGNASALHLYQKLGFESVGIRRRFYEKPVEDAVIMWTPEPASEG